VHVAEQAVLAHAPGWPARCRGGGQAARGGHLDPDLVAAFARGAEAALAPLAEPDILTAVIAAEPGVASLAGAVGMRRMCRALACVVDLKGAGELTLSARTVGNHLAHIYDKIGRRTRAGAAVYAIEAGLLTAEAGETRH
jgi:hypothetical protein